MNPPNEPSDDDLHGLLKELGHEGERRAPGFQGTWHAAKTRRAEDGRHWRPSWIAAAAAAGCLLLAVVVWRPTPMPVADASLAIDGALPTDFLLVTNNDDPVERLTGEIDALLRP